MYTKRYNINEIYRKINIMLLTRLKMLISKSFSSTSFNKQQY